MVGVELRTETVCVLIERGIVADYLLETAPSALHIFKSVEYIGKNGIASARWNLHYVMFLYRSSIKHTAW